MFASRELKGQVLSRLGEGKVHMLSVRFLIGKRKGCRLRLAVHA